MQIWSIIYGDHSGAKGIVGTETVNVGGVTVTGQAVELATVVSSQFQKDTNCDGLLGLAFSSINTGKLALDRLFHKGGRKKKPNASSTVRPTPQKSFFDSAKPQLAAQVFTADLKHQQPGTYDFGFIDPAKFKAPMTYVPVNNSRGFWSFTPSGFGVGSNFVVGAGMGVAGGHLPRVVFLKKRGRAIIADGLLIFPANRHRHNPPPPQ